MSAFLVLLSVFSAADQPLVFETDSFQYALSAEARSLAFIDRASGTNFCDTESPLSFATWIDVAAHPATHARRDGDRLVVQFGDPGREATFRVSARKRRLEFELVTVRGDAESLRELRFAAIPLSLTGTLNDAFAASPLALNLQTNCAEIPGYTSTLSGGVAFRELGFEGAAIAIVACPSGQLREALKDAVTDAEALPQSPNGGPWALDSEINRQSYFIDAYGNVNEKTVDSWIAMLNGLGIKQLDLHGGHSFRFGDYAPNFSLFPNGRDSMRAVVDTLHSAGIAVGLHTYAMFIAKDTPWVTPVPNPGLAKDAVFTLATDLAVTQTDVTVAETTKDISPATGFLVQNSATIQIDDELIVFGGVSKEPPYAFTQCTRGAYGTTPASHTRNAKVYQLKEIFGLFAPDPDSDLFLKVIEETARTYNDCGFDMMYMDALDGSGVIDSRGGGKFAWHYSAKFTYELMRRLNKPPLLEMSTFSHHLWAVRSRMGAWDACQRAPQTFADMHMLSNHEWRDHFLPTNLGWWAIFPWSGVQPKRTLPDDVEYLCAKALGTDSSLSLLLGFAPETYPQSYHQKRLGAIIARYEALRLSGVVPQPVRDQLAAPGQAFHLDDGADGTPVFRPVWFARHDIATGDGSDSWKVENPYGAQTPPILIEGLLSAMPFDSPDSTPVEDFSNLTAYSAVQCNSGVSATFSVVNSPVRESPVSAAITAKNAGSEPQRAWVSVERKLEPAINMSGRGLGVWVHGDGKGALLNIQTRSPRHVTPALSEHYVRLDFKGWRYFELIETDDYAIENYEWPYSKPRSDWQKNSTGVTSFAYPVYHAHMDYTQVGELRIALNEIPKGEEVQVFLGPIRTIPHKNVTIREPQLTFNGKRITFPVALDSGHMIEFTPPNTYALCDKDGELLASGTIEGSDAAILNTGANTIDFACTPPEDSAAHIRVTITTTGDTISK